MKKTGTEEFNPYRWYGFDVDGTIATNHKHGWEIEEPVKPMVDLMRRMHRAGCDVRIISGRLGDFRSDDEIPASVKRHIWEWCDRNLGFRPKLTGRKDSMMEALYDDRAKQVVCNKGVTYEELAKELAKALELLVEDPGKGKREAETMLEKCRGLGLL